MSRVDELIIQLCPKGVELKKLNEVFRITRGRVLSKEYLRDHIGKYPVYSSQTANNGEIGKIDTYDFDGEYLTWTTDGAHAGTVFHRNGKFSITNVCGLLKADSKNILPKFAYYVLSTLMKNFVSSGMGNPKLMSNVVGKIEIPMPPLPIQREIVSILDKFTALEVELEVELKAELDARKKQYEYYRNELLNFAGKEAEWNTLEEVCLKSLNINWEKNIGKEFRYIDLSSVNRENSRIIETQAINSTNAPSRARQVVLKNDVIFGTTRPTLKRFALIEEEYNNQICSTGFCVLRANQNILMPKFLYFILTTSSFFNYVENNQEGAGYPAIANSIVKKFEIPIPPLLEQKSIVELLDKFENLVNNISVCLPAELEARRKQYEYYRGKLLTFKPLNTN